MERKSKGGTLYLRWFDRSAANGDRLGGFRWKSLGTLLRTDHGHIIADVETWAIGEATTQSQRLAGTYVEPATVPAGTLTIAQGWALATDPDTGKYPRVVDALPTEHEREVRRAVQFAMAIWGAERAWAAVTTEDVRLLWRRRILALADEGVTGHRGAVITISRVLTVAQWLRDAGKIPATACLAPKRWRDELLKDWRTLRRAQHDPEPNRPRYTVEESRTFLGAAGQVDPRFELLVGLGAEYRPGQVARQMRSHLDLAAGTFRIRGLGKKQGTIVKLTAGQRRLAEHAIREGYLRVLERAGGDYPLFPAGQLRGTRGGTGAPPTQPRNPNRAVAAAHWQEGRSMEEIHQLTGEPDGNLFYWRSADRWPARDGDPWQPPEEGADLGPWASERQREGPTLDRSTIGRWWDAAEALAGIPKVAGRRTYSIRRASVDFNKRAKVSPEGQREGGGWVDNRMADTVYADPEQEYAQEEARDARADFRGETVAP